MCHLRLCVLRPCACRARLPRRCPRPRKFDAVLKCVRIHSQRADASATAQALRVLDAILLHCAPPAGTGRLLLARGGGPGSSVDGSSSSSDALLRRCGGGSGGSAADDGATSSDRAGESAGAGGGGATLAEWQVMQLVALAEHLCTIEALGEEVHAASSHTAQEAYRLYPTAFVKSQRGNSSSSFASLDARAGAAEDSRRDGLGKRFGRRSSRQKSSSRRESFQSPPAAAEP